MPDAEAMRLIWGGGGGGGGGGAKRRGRGQGTKRKRGDDDGDDDDGERRRVLEDGEDDRVIGGRAAAKRRRKKKRAQEDGAATDAAPEADDGDDDFDEPKLSKKSQKRKEAAEDERSRTLHVHVERGSDRNDVRTLFEDYDPRVTLHKYLSRKRQGQYATVVFKTAAMAEHAQQQFNGTDQSDLLGTPVAQVSLVRSRRQSKKHSEVTRRKKQAAWKLKEKAMSKE
eukprot:TRINITY_DN2178_c2_g1_i1.p1 TRINITY_DN2178_c2_g1~~TRINITY_DN2178_c2_g1_i1.p1  ORF type:complete len:248 (+),score=105.13 TRINITY_DN2178_c2_g1_i1:67-744(+)